MWRSSDGGRGTVTCLACGRTVDRSSAREYDKHGDRWSRRNKSFEYFCTPCHEALCHHDRGGLEDLLEEIDAGRCSDGEFLERYSAAVEDRHGSIEDR